MTATLRTLLTLGLLVAVAGVADAQPKKKKVKPIRKGAKLAKSIENENDLDRRDQMVVMAKRLSKKEKEAFVNYAAALRKKSGWTRLATPLRYINTRKATAELGAMARSQDNELGSGAALSELKKCQPRYALPELLKGATSLDAGVRMQHTSAMRSLLRNEANGTFEQRFDMLVQAMSLIGLEDNPEGLQPTTTEGMLISLASRMAEEAPDASIFARYAANGPKPLAVAIAQAAPKRLLKKTPRDLPSRLQSGKARHVKRLKLRPEVDEDDPKAVAKRNHDEEHERQHTKNEDENEDEEKLTIEEQDEEYWDSTPERTEMRTALEQERAALQDAFHALLEREERMVDRAVFKALPLVVPSLDDEWANSLISSLDPPTPIPVRDAAYVTLQRLTGETNLPRSQKMWKRWWKEQGKNATE